MDERETVKDLATEQAEFCKVFAYPSRILILWALAEKDLPVGEIAEAVGDSVQNTSHHLRIMKGLGILHAEREGKTIRYGIADRRRCQTLLKIVPETEGSLA